ncbi:hypothetical protein [Spirosoma pollinicola]|uniref:hypothetical protein n=1 Tax=Spirosoma pollinicola TaxID=2057025 RepID=UPI0012FE7B56|nr:hypothetical protein [Spirosoma pollinicola]
MTNRKELSLLLGIVAGFVFLLSFFVGLGVPTDSLLVVGGFFSIVAIAISLLLFPKKKPTQ